MKLSSVAYKKGNWLRYTLWGIAAVCIGALLYAFISTMNSIATESATDSSASSQQSKEQ